jgi:hypothetical protein
VVTAAVRLHRNRALPQPEPNERVLNQTEGVNEIVTITETAGKGRRLMTNGHAMSATWPLSQRYMRALAHVPLLMTDNPERVLVIGFGVGNTTAAATLHPTVQRCRRCGSLTQRPQSCGVLQRRKRQRHSRPRVSASMSTTGVTTSSCKRRHRMT